MTNRFNYRKPPSLDEFEKRFPDDEACAEDLFRRRWPNGFVCPDCGSRNAARLKRERCVRQCRDCRKRTSATAGTFMHRSHVSLRNWYRAIHPMTSHADGMSALQLQRRPGVGSCKTARLLARKIRRAMERADGFPLAVSVQADETSVPYRAKTSDPPRGGRSSEGVPMIAGAVEVSAEGEPGRAELREIKDCSGPTLKAFVAGERPAHEVLDWIHRVFANLERWGLGVLHGFRAKHPDRQLLEWSFRWNWRRQCGDSFFALLRAGLRSKPSTWKDGIGLSMWLV